MPERLTPKVLLIGWDAADWRMIKPLIERGALPTLQSLISRGAEANLATIRPILSPMLWTSIATGKRADKHGIHGFTEPKPDATGVRPVASTSRTCKAIWNIASQHGLKSIVINWFASHPAEPIDGVVVSDAYTSLCQPGVGIPDLSPGTVHPAEWAEPLARLLVNPAELDAAALLPFVPLAAQIDQAQDNRLAKLSTLVARAATVQAASCFALQEKPWDLACLYFGAIDEFGHHFMPYHPPRMEGIDPRDAEVYGQVMEGCYRFHDMMLAHQLAIAGEDTTVVIVSDHGFCQAGDRPGTEGYENPEQWHRPFGIGVLSGPGVKQGERVFGGTILDIAPTVLRLLGISPAMDMDGRAWVEVLESKEQLTRVLSWDDLASESTASPSTDEQDPAAAALAMRHLADLGYIDLPEGDTQQQIDQTIELQRYNLARALSDSRRSAKAIDIWRELVEAHPDETGYRFELARCLAGLKRHDEALDEISQISDRPGVALLQAKIYMDQGRYDEARKQIEQQLSETPDSVAALIRLGQIHLKQNEFTKARKRFERAAELESENAVIADALSELALKEQNPQTAVDHALDAVSLAHYFPRAHYHLGCGLAALGDTERALLALRTCLELAPNFQPAHEILAQLEPESTTAAAHELAAASARINLSE